MIPVATGNPTAAVDEHIGFVVVFGDKVLVEEAEGPFGGCGGEPDNEGVEGRIVAELLLSIQEAISEEGD